ncbi:MAG: HDOD domain-containing protein [Acidobacteriota bacterium]
MASAGQLEIRNTVVVIDDEEEVLDSVRTAFKNEPVDVYCFAKGEEALLYMKRQPIDVVIADLRMPAMNGIELLNVASHFAPEAVRVILGTADDKGVGLAAISKGISQQFLQKPWTAHKLRTTIHDILEQRRETHIKEMQTLLVTFTELPSAPQFHNRLNGLLKNDDKYLRLIIEEIEKNPALTAKLLRTANSVFFGARKNISNVNDAVRFIGVEYVASLVLAIEAYYQICMQSHGDLSALMEEVWDESLKRAELAKLVAMEWKVKCEPRLIYVTALLQDIGYVARLCHQPELYQRYHALCQLNRGREYEIETHLYTQTHEDLAAALLKLWNFPVPIISAIKKHHRYAGDDVTAQVIQVATVLVNGNVEVPHDPALEPAIEEFERKLLEVPGQFVRRMP